MIVLGIETSTAACSVGLAGDFGTPVECSMIESRIHSEKLLTLVQAVCERQRMKVSQLDAVAVSIGPGSFTGLRIGLSSAKGLCYALKKPLIAIPTFESIASAVSISHPEFSRIVVCVDAKQGEYYIGAYEKNGGVLNLIVPVQRGVLASIAAIAETSMTIVVTDRVDELKKIVNNSGLIKNILPYCRGEIVASLGCDKLNIGQTSDIESVEPCYLKDFVVQKRVKSEG